MVLADNRLRLSPARLGTCFFVTAMEPASGRFFNLLWALGCVFAKSSGGNGLVDGALDDRVEPASPRLRSDRLAFGLMDCCACSHRHVHATVLSSPEVVWPDVGSFRWRHHQRRFVLAFHSVDGSDYRRCDCRIPIGFMK